MSATISNRNVLSAEIRLSRTGAWHCLAEVDGDTALTGAVTIDVEGVQFCGWVKLSKGFAGRAQAWIVGGKGKLAKKLDARHYSGTKAMTVATDICHEAGEVLASRLSLSQYSLTHWERSSGQASHCLLALCDRLGLAWRVQLDGKVWIGVEAWPTVAPKVETEDENWPSGWVQVYGETFGENAKLLPGTTWDSHQLEEVAHYITPDSIRTIVKIDSISAAMGRFLDGIRHKIELSNSYVCEVTGQNADGTLRLKPVDERIAKAGNGLDKVSIKYGLPGFEAKVSNGAHVRVQFEGGNPDAPFAAIWDQGGTGVESLEFKPGGIGSPVVRVGDELEVTFPMGMLLTLSPPYGAGVVTVATPARAIITGTGNSKLLA